MICDTTANGNIEPSTPLMNSPAAPRDVSASSVDTPESLFPLSGLEMALIRGFRRLPDEEMRSSFVDVVEEAVTC